MARPKAEDPKVPLNARVPQSLRNRLSAGAAEQEIEFQAYVEQVLRQGLDGPAQEPQEEQPTQAKVVVPRVVGPGRGQLYQCTHKDCGALSKQPRCSRHPGSKMKPL